MTVRMHRLQRTRYSGSLVHHLSVGETLSSIEFKAERRGGLGWVDLTPQFVESASVKVGSDQVTVNFWKRAASNAAEQIPGEWRLVVTAVSSDDEVLIGIVSVDLVG